MTLEQIRAAIAEKQQRRNALKDMFTRFAAGETVEGLNGETFEERSKENADLNNDILRLRAQEQTLINSADFTRSGTVVVKDKEVITEKNMLGSEEYRNQFQEYIRSGAVGSLLKTRATVTQTGDVTAVIVPTTITSQLFVTNQQAGTLFDRVTKTNYQFGVEYPLSDSSFELEWLAESTTASTSKGESKTKISFTGFKGQIKFAISLEAETFTLPDFEKAITSKIQEGIRLSFDKVILNGTGVGQPKGILSEEVYDKAASFTDATVDTYKAHLAAYSNIPLAKQAKSVLVINKTDWLNHLVGIKDNNDRVVAFDTVGFGGMPTSVFMGRPVIQLEDQGLSTYAGATAGAAAKGSCFGLWVVLEDYTINMNKNITMRKYIDEATDDIVTKYTLIADGKTVNKTSIVPLCKASS